jgi:cell division protein FtsN
MGDTIRTYRKKDRREKNLTEPTLPPPAADPKRRTRQRLLIAAVLIGLAIAGLAAFEQLREHPGNVPAPHEPSQALISPPSPAAPEASATAAQAQAEEPPPPPVVVNEPDSPEPAATTPRALPPAAAESAAYLIQAGVFTSPDNARSLQQKLAKAGIRAKVETRVQLGPYKDRREAEKDLTKLKKLGISAVMVPAR